MSSNMVSLGNAVPASNTCSLRAHPFLASSPICSSELLFRVARWAPRSGRGAKHSAWLRDVRHLLRAFALTEADVEGTIPTLDSFLSVASPSLVGEPEERVPLSLRQAHRDAVISWRAVNTALYWHVLPHFTYIKPYAFADLALIGISHPH